MHNRITQVWWKYLGIGYFLASLYEALARNLWVGALCVLLFCAAMRLAAGKSAWEAGRVHKPAFLERLQTDERLRELWSARIRWIIAAFFIAVLIASGFGVKILKETAPTYLDWALLLVGVVLGLLIGIVRRGLFMIGYR